MKFIVQMKDPDTLYDAITDAVAEHIKGESLSEDEREAVKELRVEKIQKICSQWFKYSEYLSVEIDTEAETCTVLPAER